MPYTVTELAKISHVSVRTLHWYDEINLLKPAYYGPNGYRYYEEEQHLILKQILFFRELGFELKQIKEVLEKNDIYKIAVLNSHRQVLQKNLEKIRTLIKTIDKAVEHLKGVKKVKEDGHYFEMDELDQLDYEEQLAERFGTPKAFVEKDSDDIKSECIED